MDDSIGDYLGSVRYALDDISDPVARGLTWLIVAYAIVFGVLLIGLGARLKSRRSRKQSRTPLRRTSD